MKKHITVKGGDIEGSKLVGQTSEVDEDLATEGAGYLGWEEKAI